MSVEWLPHIATITVAIIAALSAFATQRQASKANRQAQLDTIRADSEVEAFNRARAFDVGTIERQNAVIKEQASELKAQKQERQLDKEELKLKDRKIEELRNELAELKRGIETAEDS